MESSLNTFMELFRGRDDAYGLGEGKVERAKLTSAMYEKHLAGEESGLGIFPMLDGDKVWFAAIDLDEPDFDTGRMMQEFLPGPSYIEESRSGNCHVWCFFDEPVEAWVVRGILRYATEAAEKPGIEIFPKQDRLMREDSLGNYINLPYHGKSRPILRYAQSFEAYLPISLQSFLDGVELNEAEGWRRRARWLGLESPEARESEHGEFGTRPYLHICAEHIIAEREHNPIVEGHRAVVYFNLAKMLLNYEAFDEEETLYYMRLVNDASPDPVQDWEIRRMVDNASRGQFISTGCDDPLMAPYVHPDCPIANRNH